MPISGPRLDPKALAAGPAKRGRGGETACAIRLGLFPSTRDPTGSDSQVVTRSVQLGKRSKFVSRTSPSSLMRTRVHAVAPVSAKWS